LIEGINQIPGDCFVLYIPRFSSRQLIEAMPFLLYQGTIPEHPRVEEEKESLNFLPSLFF